MAKGKKTGGRKPGSPNKFTGVLKDAILEGAKAAGEEIATNAADKKNGMATYLRTQAVQNPTAYLGLVGRVLPMTLMGDGEDGEIIVNVKVSK